MHRTALVRTLGTSTRIEFDLDGSSQSNLDQFGYGITNLVPQTAKVPVPTTGTHGQTGLPAYRRTSRIRPAALKVENSVQYGDIAVPRNQDWAAHLFTSESVSMGHPDKVADQISDAILDSLLRHDPLARVAVETLVTTNYALVSGEATTHNKAAEDALANVEHTVRDTIAKIGYTDPQIGFDHKSCEVVSKIHPQSPDISQGVTEGEGLHAEAGAGDQGMMFGFACDETETFMPLPIQLAHRLVERLAKLRQTGKLAWVRPDAKSQVTVAYEDGLPAALHTVVISTQHTADSVDERTNQLSDDAKRQIRELVIDPVIREECPQFASDDVVVHVNPTGRFVIGGPHGDCGLTGRKIIVDTYGGRGRHGGGAFSGKDPTKVDRSATYMARHIAKNIVAAGLARQCEVQLAYAIGVADPVSVSVDTFGTGVVSAAILERIVREEFPLTPRGIIDYLDLRRPIYFETARHGHFGRTGYGFTWEKTHRVADIQAKANVLQTA
ncbi:MAG: methionine adenosyltransferase [Phycisphaerales bacterium]|nr:MAG: methionine adenosyltransferase [Phycisphaerales bacterium]